MSLLVRVSVPISLAWVVGCSAERSSSDGSSVAVPVLTELRTYGCEACIGAELMGSVTHVSLLDDSTLAVLTQDAPRVRLWNLSSGSSLVSFGDSAPGTGELRNPVGLTMTPAGSIAVVNRDGRLSVFDWKGNYQEEYGRRHLVVRPLANWSLALVC
jgi:hypothetical protein